jgi:hypothetical protein
MNPGDQNAAIARRAWYRAPLQRFVDERAESILGELAANSDFSVDLTQRDAWMTQVEVLQESLRGLDGHLLLEFTIPRMGRRVDAVLLAGPVVFAMEFKVGAETFDRAALDQVWDYALDLKNFHEASHHAIIVPILVSTGATPSPITLVTADDHVMEPVGLAPDQLRSAIDEILASARGVILDRNQWEGAPYKPTPTIIEAARALYAHHTVDEIARTDAGAQNLAITSGRIEEIIHESRTHTRKSICFVTGVPGAGKTLVGLDIATHRHNVESENAVFLSGNGPLVAVLREALVRDELERRKAQGEKARKGKVAESVKAFIQNVHHFRDDALQHPGAPPEHVAVFDEAQRAWNLRQTANFMLRKRRIPDFAMSEPEFLISCMDRHPDWATIVCLVGGGQEINLGEAGIDAWLDAIESKFPRWRIHISSNLTDSEYAAGQAVERAIARENCTLEDSLHLAVSMRSFRAENVSHFVKALLDCDAEGTRVALASLRDRYPLRVTRDLDLAKAWIRRKARGTERTGLVCSSKAMRLKPHAIDVRHNVDPVHWFLNPPADTRSSCFLEDAATEFQVQGLEVDWACVNWDADLRFAGKGCSHHDFRGSRWVNIHNDANQRYLLNAYRVLLTRARQGMVIFVPPGERSDPTRDPEWYDATFNYLKSTGIPELKQ